MTDQPTTPGGTGSVSSRAGKVTARNIITGIDLSGVESDAVVVKALESMEKLRTGSVWGEKGVEASGDIVTGFRILNPEQPTQAAFIQELESLRDELAKLGQDVPAEATKALKSVEETLGEAQADEPRGPRIRLYLQEAIEFIGKAADTLSKAHAAAPLIYKAGAVLAGLLAVASKLFGGQP